MRTSNKLTVLLCATLAVGAVSGCKRNRRGGGGAAATVRPTTTEDRTLYALGMFLAQRVAEFHLVPREVRLVQQGFADQTAGHPQFALSAYQERLGELAESRANAQLEPTRRAGATYAAAAAAEPGAVRTESGMVYRELTAGTGAQPSATDEVTVHYTGSLIDGTEFDSSRRRNEPATFALNGVIPCWTQGVARMRVGGRAKLVCPSDIAYGNRGRPPRIPGGATLVFDVELVSIRSRETPDAGAPVDTTSPALPGAAATPPTQPTGRAATIVPVGQPVTTTTTTTTAAH